MNESNKLRKEGLFAEILHQVEFSETDMAGIVHFSNYFRWMEVAENALFESLNLELIEQDRHLFRGWPRVRASCAFHHPLRFRDHVKIRISGKEVKDRAVCYQIRFFKLKNHDCILVGKGEMTTIFVEIDCSLGSMKSMPLEDKILSRLSS